MKDKLRTAEQWNKEQGVATTGGEKQVSRSANPAEQLVVVQLVKIKREVAEEICAAYDEYLKCLSAEIDEIVGIASVHGWHSQRVEEGQRHRDNVQRVKDKYLGE